MQPYARVSRLNQDSHWKPTNSGGFDRLGVELLVDLFPLLSSAPGAPVSAPREGDGTGEAGDTCLGSQVRRHYLRGGDSAEQSEMLSCRVQTGKVEFAAIRDPALTVGSSEGLWLICARDAAGAREVSGEGAQTEARGADGRGGHPPSFRKLGGGRARRRGRRRLVAAPSSGWSVD